jgi:hypothetical protein
MTTPIQMLVLAENNSLNKSLMTGTNCSVIERLEGMTSQHLRLERDCDEIIIEGIEVDANDLHSLYKIKLIIGGQNIVSIKFSLLFDLIGKKSNKIFFPKNIIPPVQIVSLQYHYVNILVEGEDDIKYKLILKKKYYNDQIRTQIAENSQQHIFNEFNSYKFLNTNKINLSENFNNSKGFYLKTHKKLNNVKFELDNQIICEYDHDEIIHCFGKPNILWKYAKEHKLLLYKISLPKDILRNINGFLDGLEESLYWLSIMPDNKPDSIQDTHINLARRKFFLILDNIYLGEITNVTNNIFVTKSGMGGLKFAH